MKMLQGSNMDAEQKKEQMIGGMRFLSIYLCGNVHVPVPVITKSIKEDLHECNAFSSLTQFQASICISC